MHFIAALIFCVGLWLMWGDIIQDKFSPASPPNAFIASLSDVEQAYYQQVFDYTMTAIPAGESYTWEGYNGKGTISVSKVFQSNMGSTCRSFSEVYTSNGVESSAQGTSCKREGKDGWCRLQRGDAATCAMEPPTNLVDKAKSAADALVNAGKDGLVKAQGLTR